MSRMKFTAALLLLCAAAYAQTGWQSYGGDAGSMRYSPLTQINTGNAAQLTQAWVFDTRPEPGAKATRISQATPARDQRRDVRGDRAPKPGRSRTGDRQTDLGLQA